MRRVQAWLLLVGLIGLMTAIGGCGGGGGSDAVSDAGKSISGTLIGFANPAAGTVRLRAQRTDRSFVTLASTRPNSDGAYWLPLPANLGIDAYTWEDDFEVVLVELSYGGDLWFSPNQLCFARALNSATRVTHVGWSSTSSSTSIDVPFNFYWSTQMPFALQGSDVRASEEAKAAETALRFGHLK